jgi:aminoglycoside phosphotransferase (APT) family kinase protein
METRTKPKLTNLQLSQAVFKAFGPKTKIIRYSELYDGLYNTCYILNLDSMAAIGSETGPREIILKAAPKPAIPRLTYEEGIMDTEVNVLKLLKNSLPVPEVYFYDDTKSLIPVEYFFMEKIKGITYQKIKETLTRDQRKEIEFESGILHRKIHQATSNYFGYPAPCQAKFTDWTEAFYHMLEQLISDGKRAGIQFDWDKTTQAVVQRKEYLGDVKVPVLVHHDLWEGNMFVQEQNSHWHITGIIDFERCIWGDPLMEFVFSRASDQETMIHGTPAFYDGYGTKLFRTKSEIERRKLYDLYLFLIMKIEGLYRGYAEEGFSSWINSSLTEIMESL